MKFNMKRVLFISSTGGHLSELMKLEKLFKEYDSYIITEKDVTTEYLKEKYKNKIAYLPYCTRSKIFKEQQIDVNSMSVRELLSFIKENPSILKRPIIVDESKIQDMAVEELLNEKLNDIPPGSDGLVLQPYWGPGLRRPLAKGGVIGFSDIHTREHFYRAIIEGIGYALKEGLESIEKSQHHKVKELRISGGGSQSDAICQITADIFNIPVSRVQTYETTSLGEAIATFVAIGEFKDINEAMEAMTHKTMTFYPVPEAAEQYQELYKHVYIRMYPRLKRIYRYINKFTKRY